MSNTSPQQQCVPQIRAPLPRLTLISPYENGYTKSVLDMRRKAEILKYSANQQSSQTNNLTKRQSFAMIARGASGRSSSVNNKIDSCPTTIILTPTSSSDVPGPIMYLSNDESAPLYNYAPSQTSRTYAEYIPDKQDKWIMWDTKDIRIANSGTNILGSLVIYNAIPKTSYNFNILVPIGITISGYFPQGSVQLPVILTASIASLTFTFMFNGQEMRSVQIPFSGGSPAILSISVPNTLTQFVATQYIGSVSLPQDIVLYTVPSYSYDIRVTVNNLLINNRQTIPNVGAYAIINMSEDTNVATGCSITSSVPQIYEQLAVSMS